jgi:hypothetical protein
MDFQGYMEDCSAIGTFQYRLKGFDESPTDFYMRPFFTHVESWYHKYAKYCIGSIPRHKVMMNYVQNILQYKKTIPKFLFSFRSELSHDNTNAIQGVDLDLKNFLEGLKDSGALNSTVLIVMSDHGARFSEFRGSSQGKQEERMPMFIFIFPPTFKTTYKTAYDNFLRNSEILSTPFDIHATLQDILNLPNLSPDEIDNHFEEPYRNDGRQLSLFHPVPQSRNCHDAKIDPHWYEINLYIFSISLNFECICGNNLLYMSLAEFLKQVRMFAVECS